MSSTIRRNELVLSMKPSQTVHVQKGEHSKATAHQKGKSPKTYITAVVPVKCADSVKPKTGGNLGDSMNKGRVVVKEGRRGARTSALKKTCKVCTLEG